MSRVGKQPVPIEGGVKASFASGVLQVSGPNGSLEQSVDPRIKVTIEADAIQFEPLENSRQARAMHGLYRSLAANMCEGVTKGFQKSLEVEGTGYGAQVAGQQLTLQVGFCHDVKVAIPQGLDVSCPSATRIDIKGADKQMVGDFAARVRKVRPPEPYKGKGIRFSDEQVRRKPGKTLAK